TDKPAIESARAGRGKGCGSLSAVAWKDQRVTRFPAAQTGRNIHHAVDVALFHPPPAAALLLRREAQELAGREAAHQEPARHRRAAGGGLNHALPLPA